MFDFPVQCMLTPSICYCFYFMFIFMISSFHFLVFFSDRQVSILINVPSITSPWVGVNM